MTTKTCKTCKNDKPVDDFPLREKGIRRAHCKPCWSASRRTQYHTDGPERKDVIQKRNAEFRRKAKQRNFTWLWAYFKDNPCPCGESDPIALQLDHRDPAQKEHNVSALMAWAPLERVQAEVAKCDVLCANCHMKRTAKQFGWYQTFIDSST